MQEGGKATGAGTQWGAERAKTNRRTIKNKTEINENRPCVLAKTRPRMAPTASLDERPLRQSEDIRPTFSATFEDILCEPTSGSCQPCNVEEMEESYCRCAPQCARRYRAVLPVLDTAHPVSSRFVADSTYPPAGQLERL